MQLLRAIQENMELQADGYQGDVIGEATPDVLVNEFVSLLPFYYNPETDLSMDQILLFLRSMLIISEFNHSADEG